MTRSSPLDIVIAGGGTAGWVAAATFARFLGNHASITLVESDEIGTVGVGEATIPQIHNLINGLGLDQAEFLRATNGTFKLGIEFDGWSGDGSNYIHSFGYTGRGVGLIPFRQLWLRGRGLGVAGDFGDYSFNIAAARLGRMSTNAGSGTVPDLAYAYHFDASLFAKMLRGYAEEPAASRASRARSSTSSAMARAATSLRCCCNGERRVPATCSSIAPASAACCSARRWTSAISTGASGCRAIRVGGPMPVERRVPALHPGDVAQGGMAVAHPAPAPDRQRPRLLQQVPSRDDEAAAILLANLDGEALADPRPIRFTSGRRETFWSAMSSRLGLRQGSWSRWNRPAFTSSRRRSRGCSNLLPRRPSRQRRCARQFQPAVTRSNGRAIRDFIVLHYHRQPARRRAVLGRAAATWGRPTAAYQQRSSCSVRPALGHARARRVVSIDDSWGQVMIGQGIMPDELSSARRQCARARTIGAFLETLERAHMIGSRGANAGRTASSSRSSRP